MPHSAELTAFDATVSSKDWEFPNYLVVSANDVSLNYPKVRNLVSWSTSEAHAATAVAEPMLPVVVTLADAGVRLLIEGICKQRRIIDGEVVGQNGKSARKGNLGREKGSELLIK
jgi:hypothetical protein